MICSVAGCERAARTRQLCPTHYKRWQRHGDPLAQPTRGRHQPDRRPPVTLNDVAYVDLGRDRVALIDPEDIGLVNDRSWYLKRWRRVEYAVAVDFPHVRMHSLIGGAGCDHINHDGLDNRRSNLRPATVAEQSYNRRPRQGNRSGYKGVVITRGGKFVARITVDGTERYLGTYLTAEEAACAYDQSASQHFGAFAYLNFPKP